MFELKKKMDAMQPISKMHVKLTFSPNGYDETPLFIIILKGKQPGPNLWVQGGLHGDEYEGPAVAYRLATLVNLEKLKGSLVIVPIVNYTAFFARMNGSPIDNLNLNRVFPGKYEGSYSQRFGWWLFKLINSVADYHIDLHGGGQYLDVMPFVMMSGANSTICKDMKEMACASGTNYIYQNNATEGFLYAALAYAGIPAILLESGGGVYWKEVTTKWQLESIFNIMRYLGMLPTKNQIKLEQAVTIKKVIEIYFVFDGFQIYNIDVGSTIKAGTTLLEYISIATGEKNKIISPIDDGLVLSIHKASVVRRGEYCAMLGVFSK